MVLHPVAVMVSIQAQLATDAAFSSRARVYIEVISFDALINGAAERSRAFFDKLGLPASP